MSGDLNLAGVGFAFSPFGLGALPVRSVSGLDQGQESGQPCDATPPARRLVARRSEFLKRARVPRSSVVRGLYRGFLASVGTSAAHAGIWPAISAIDVRPPPVNQPWRPRT